MVLRRISLVALVVTSSGATEAQPRSGAQVPPLLPDSLFLPLRSPAVLPFGYPPNDIHKPAVLDLVGSRRFDQIEAFFGSLRRAVADDVRHESRLITAYDALDRDDPQLLSSIDAWIDAKPSSADAFAARARYTYYAAWRARGRRSIDQTTVGRLRAMADKAELSIKDALVALDMDSTHMMAYLTILNLMQIAGSHDVSYQILQKSLTIHRGSHQLRYAYLNGLRPRWGGSYEAMAAFAEASMRDSLLNPRLATLRGVVLEEQAFTLVVPLPEDSLRPPNRRAAIDSLTKALMYGPSGQVYAERGELYFEIGDFTRAYLDLRRALILLPQDSRTLAWYGHALVQLAHRTTKPIRGAMLDRAAEALALAVYLQPTDRTARANLNWARSAKAQCMRLPQPCR